MSEYAIGVFVISALSGLLSHLSYKGRGDPSGIALAIVTLYVIISPIAVGLCELDFESVFDVDYDSGVIGGGYEEVAEEAFSDGILSLVAGEFSLSREDLRVEIRGFDFDEMRCEKIRVILSGRAVFSDYKGIEKYLNELDIGVCECEIEI